MVVVAAVRMKKVAAVVVRGIGLVMVVMMVGMRLEQQQQQQRGKEEAEARSKRERERGLGTKERRAAVAVGSGFGRGRWAACRLVGWLGGRREAARERVKGALELGVEIRRRRRVIRVRQSLRLKYDTKAQF